MEETDQNTKCEILADLWIRYKGDAAFAEFMAYNDLGLPLAYALANNIVPKTEIAEGFITETFDLLLASVGVEDQGFDDLDDILMVAGSE